MPISDIAAQLTGHTEFTIEPHGDSKNALYRITGPAGQFALKIIEPNAYEAHTREVAMRTALRDHTSIRFPEIAASLDLEGTHYLLLEFVDGVDLTQWWAQHPEAIPHDAHVLGEMLSRIHAIPVTSAGMELTWDQDVYDRGYIDELVPALAPHVPEATLMAIGRAHGVARAADVERVICHSDFGPHQVIVDTEGAWALIDFEFAGIGPYADDVAGTEVRLRRLGFDAAGSFLDGYFAASAARAEYEAIAPAFRLVVLALITSFRARRQIAPTDRDLLLLATLAQPFADPS